MSLPLWDPIHLPPDYTLVDVNAIEDDDERAACQAKVLDTWRDEEGLAIEDEVLREWDDNEGAFIVFDGDGVAVGVAIILDVEDV